MCTATYFKDADQRIIFTTNRDEHASRPTAPPAIHNVNGLQLLFPQDKVASGTWIALSENGHIACMMNGAEGEHSWLGTAAEKSRGQVLLDSFQFDDANVFMKDGGFEQAHPFTLLLIRPGQDNVVALKWNGSEKWIDQFDANSPHIWSAHTLYPPEQRKERFELFQQWSKDADNLNKEDAFKLHKASKTDNGLRLENSNKVDTISITQIVLGGEVGKMSYYELESSLNVKKQLIINPSNTR